MSSRPSVALLIETSNGYARGLLEGIIAYVRAHDAWSIWLPEQSRGETPPAWLSRWKGQGVIARIETPEIAAAVQKLRVPVIDVSAARTLPDIPWAETDDAAMARLACEHLAERGFRRLAFVGDPRFNWSKWRQMHFEAWCADAGVECHVFPALPTRRDSVAREGELLRDWLKTLPQPTGILACYDIKAQLVLEICRELDIAVPEQVAVLGIDNDELLCNLCTPPLSSIQPDSRRTGYLAAELLTRILAGEVVPPQAHLIPPLGVVTRRSTDVLAIEDREVATALRFIREHAREGIDVSDVLRVTPLSRRVLEGRFREALGRSPHQEILRVRLEHVCRLLTQTDLSLAEIAARTGFAHPEYLTVAFKRELGQPPSVYRKEHTGGTPAE